MRRAVFLLLLTSASGALAQNAPTYAQVSGLPQDELLRRWATSRCLAKAFDKTPAGEDARASAGAYLEAGKVEAEAYAKLDAMIDAALAAPASGAANSRYDVLKCVEFAHGRELLDASRKLWRRFKVKP